MTVLAIAQAIARGLKIPAEAIPAEVAAQHFGGLAFAVGANLCATSTLTQQRLSWHPVKMDGFVADLDASTAYAG